MPYRPGIAGASSGIPPASAQTPSAPVSSPEAKGHTSRPNVIEPAVINKSDKAMLALKTYQVEWVGSFTSDGETRHSFEKVTATKPNRFRYES